MQIEGWKYYNHALIATTAPHRCPDIMKIKDGSIWEEEIVKNAVLVRWTDNYDDERYQDWWYTVYDKPLNFSLQKKSHRRKIKKGLANFECHEITPADYAEEMARITKAAWMQYHEKYRPTTPYEALVDSYKKCKDRVIGCFNLVGGLCAFDILIDHGDFWSLGQGKADPEYERGTEINAAITYTELMLLKDDISCGKYLSNGQRNMLHETNFNDDLVHWYGFRKAYCRLNIAYNPKYKWIVKALYPFRSVLKLFSNIPIVNSIYTVLNMEEICRKQRRIKV